MSKKIPARQVLNVTPAVAKAIAAGSDRVPVETSDDVLAVLNSRKRKPAAPKAASVVVEQPKRNGSVAALKACRTMVERQLAGASASVRKQLKAKIADYDRRIAAAA